MLQVDFFFHVVISLLTLFLCFIQGGYFRHTGKIYAYMSVCFYIYIYIYIYLEIEN